MYPASEEAGNSRINSDQLAVSSISSCGGARAGAAVISGHLHGALEEAPEPMQVVLLWGAGTVEQIREQSFPGTTAPVSGEFPGYFEMPLYHPPPSSAFQYKEQRLNFAMALVLALPVGSIVDGRVLWSDLSPEDIGVNARNHIIYLTEDAQPGSPIANYLGDTAKAGYHILEASLIYKPAQDAWFACRDSEELQPNLDLCYERHCPANSDKPDRTLTTCGEEAYEEACGPRPISDLVDLGNRAEISITMYGYLEPSLPEGTTIKYPASPYPRENPRYIPEHLVDELCND